MFAVCACPCGAAEEVLGSFWRINGRLLTAHAEGCSLGVLPQPKECWEFLQRTCGLYLLLQDIWDSGCLSTDLG